jgi:biopolymer transport protein ExbD
MAGWDDDEFCEQEIKGINVTPLVDTALVLLLVFMVATPVLMNQTVRLKLPKVAHSKPAMITTVAITLKKGDKLFLNGRPTTYKKIRGQLAERVENARRRRRAEPGRKHKLQAIIAADAVVPHGKVMHLVDVIKDVGVQEFAFNIKKVEKVPPP